MRLSLKSAAERRIHPNDAVPTTVLSASCSLCDADAPVGTLKCPGNLFQGTVNIGNNTFRRGLRYPDPREGQLDFML